MAAPRRQRASWASISCLTVLPAPIATMCGRLLSSHLGALGEMCKGYKVADVVAILGSIDITMGEVDR